MKFRAGAGFTVLLWATSAVASGKIDFGPPQRWVQPAALPSEGTPTQTPIKILLVDREIRFSARTEEMYVEEAVKIQSAQGLSAVGTLAIAWNPDNDQVTVHKVQILRGGEHVDVLAAGQKFIIARRETNLNYAALDGTLTGVIQPAGLQIGDIVDFAYTLQRSDPVLAGTSEADIGGLGNAPISRLHIRAQWPTVQAIQWRARDGINAMATQVGGITNVSVDQDDVPAVVQPNGAPARYVVDPRVEFSSFSSWSQVGSRLSALYDKAAVIRPHSPLLAELARIRAASPDPSARAAMALELVENQVHYVYLGMNQGGLVPAPPDLTWSRRFGDCKAKTVLLMAILRSLSIDATPVAVSTVLGALLPDRLPMVELLDHVLVRSEIGGKTYWLDGTRLGDHGLDNLPVPYYHWAVPLTPTGSELVMLQPPPPTEPLINTSIRIDATSGITLPAPFHVESLLRGDVALATKLRLASLAPNQLNDSLRQYWAKQYGFVQIGSVAAVYDDKSATERWTMDGTAHMDWGGNQYETDGQGIGYQANFSRQPGPNHDAPYAVAYPFYNQTTETILLPDDGIGFSVTAKDVDRSVAGIEYHRHASLAHGVFTSEASQRSVATEFPALEAQSAQQALLDLSKATLYVNAPGGYSPTDIEVADGILRTIKETADFTTRGNMLLDRERYDAAIEDFDAALAIDPHDANILADRAIGNVGQRDLADAQQDLTNAYRLDPHNEYVFQGRGLLAMAMNDYPAAVAAFTDAFKIDTKDAFALQMRSRSEVRLGKRQQALADVSHAIDLEPKQALLYWERAMVWRWLGKKDAALQEPRKLLRADPGDATAYLVAGQIYSELGQRSLAVQALSRSIEIQPTEAAYVARELQRPTTDLLGRRGDLEAAVRLNPTSARDLAWLAQAAANDRDYNEAISMSTRAIGIGGDIPQLLAVRGVGYIKTHQMKSAEQDFSEAVIRAKTAADMNNVCSILAEYDVELGRALDICDAAVDKGSGPAKADYFDSRGLVLMRLGRWKEAIASYDAALAIKPLRPSSLYGRGICELRTGDRKDASDDLHAGELFSNGTVAAQFKSYGVGP